MEHDIRQFNTCAGIPNSRQIIGVNLYIKKKEEEEKKEKCTFLYTFSKIGRVEEVFKLKSPHPHCKVSVD